MCVQKEGMLQYATCESENVHQDLKGKCDTKIGEKDSSSSLIGDTMKDGNAIFGITMHKVPTDMSPSKPSKCERKK